MRDAIDILDELDREPPADPETERICATLPDDAAKRLRRFSRTADAYWRATQPPLHRRILYKLRRRWHRFEMWLDYWLYELWSRYTEYCVRRGLLDRTDGLMRQTRTGEYEMSHCRTCGHHEGEHRAPVQGQGFVIRDARGCSVPGCTCSRWWAIREYAAYMAMARDYDDEDGYE